MAMSYAEVQSHAGMRPDGREVHSPLEWLSRAGIGLLSFFSAVNDASTGSKDKPEAKYAERPVEQPIPECCSLARPDRECHYTYQKSEYSCPDGYHQQYWTCCEGTHLVGCGECTTSTSTCWQGDFECSIWWDIEGSC